MADLSAFLGLYDHGQNPPTPIKQYLKDVFGDGTVYVPYSATQGGAVGTPADITFFSAKTANFTGAAFACSGYPEMLLEVTATVAMSGGTAVVFKGSRDGTNYYSINGTLLGSPSGTCFTSVTAPGVYRIDTADWHWVRVDLVTYSAGNVTAIGSLIPVTSSGLSTQVTLSTALSQSIDSILSYPFGHSVFNITAGGTYAAVKTGIGVLHTVTFNKPVASEVHTIYDSLTASGSKIATITLPGTLVAQGPYTATYNAGFNNGLTIVATSTSDVTYSYR